jgi:DNA-binding response OmpR family regulator
MSKILVIEDEVHVSSFIKKGLEEEGHFVDVAYDGETGLNLACNQDYEVIILDVILPVINGLEICRKVRERHGYTIPILMLTALASSDDVITGLNTGADDYLVKPFKFKELLARINAVLRRKALGNVTKTYKIADVELDTETMTVKRAGKTVELTAKEFRLLEFFMLNHRRVLSRTTILEHVWDTNHDLGTNIVEVYIKYLRDKLDKNFDSKLIHTIIGMGYVFKEAE